MSKMKCPKDLADAVNNDDEFKGYVYDMGLMPEQITTKYEVCGLRGAFIIWKAIKFKNKNKILIN